MEQARGVAARARVGDENASAQIHGDAGGIMQAAGEEIQFGAVRETPPNAASAFEDEPCALCGGNAGAAIVVVNR